MRNAEMPRARGATRGFDIPAFPHSRIPLRRLTVSPFPHSRIPAFLLYPGGQPRFRPASTCRWMWNTVCPAFALQLNTVR